MSFKSLLAAASLFVSLNSVGELAASDPSSNQQAAVVNPIPAETQNQEHSTGNSRAFALMAVDFDLCGSKDTAQSKA